MKHYKGIKHQVMVTEQLQSLYQGVNIKMRESENIKLLTFSTFRLYLSTDFLHSFGLLFEISCSDEC